MSAPKVDLGSGYSYQFVCWSPDRELNPQYDGIPDVEHFGAIITCPHNDYGGMITFDSEVARKIEPAGHPLWQVESFDPLTVSPSILMNACGCHGFIKQGKWQSA